MSKLFQREYDFLLNNFAYPKVEWFYVDVSEQDYSSVYDEYDKGIIKLIKQGNMRGILINDAAKVVAAYGEGNQDNYPFARLEQTVLFKCSATDCEKLGILNLDDNFEYKDKQEQGQNTGVIEGVLNQKYIRYRNEWYKVVDIRKGNVYTGEPSNVIFTAEIVSDLEQAVNSGSFGVSGGELQIIELANKFNVYIDDTVYGEYEVGANVNLSPASKEGYKFKGFESYDVNIIDNSFTMPDNDVYISAIYAPIFTVTIDDVILGSFEVGDTVNIDAGTKEGFDFTEWTGNINVADPTKNKTSFTMPDFAVELQSNWSVVINTWTVIVNGTMDMDGTYNVTKGESINLVSGNQNQYDFSRWNIISGSCEGDLTQTYTTITPTSDINIQCVWQFNNKWLVSYSGMEKAAEWILAGSIVYLNAPDKVGYNFSEWTSNAQITFSAPNSAYSSFTMPAQNITVTANYVIKTYTITFYSDGAEYDTIVVNYGDTVNRPTDPTKQYYTFNEWQDAQGNSVDFSAPIYEDKNYYADFTHNKYTVTFNANGGTNVSSIEVFGGDKIGTLPSTTKEGYILTGWFIGSTQITPNYVVTSNIEVLAQWEEEPEFDEVALIDLNSCVEIDYYNRMIQYQGVYMSSGTDISSIDHLKIPMYVGKYYTDTLNMSLMTARNTAYSNIANYVPSECYNSWKKPFNEPYPPYADGTGSNIGWNYSNAAQTKFVTYSKWLYDAYDDDKEDLPHNPSIEISGNYRYFRFTHLFLAPLINGGNQTAALLKVTDIGRGWYRYEWGTLDSILSAGGKSMPSTVSYTYTQDPI